MAIMIIQCLKGCLVSTAKQMRTALFWVITQRVVVISYRRFGTTYRSYPQGLYLWTWL